MSIGVERVNGGVISGQWTEGELRYFRVTGPATAFAGSFSDEDKAAPGSAAEAVYRVLAQYGTPVIFEIKSATQIDVAMAYGSGAMIDPVSGDPDAPEADIQAFGAAAVFKKFGGAGVTGDDGDLVDTAALNFTAATVVEGDFRVANI